MSEETPLKMNSFSLATKLCGVSEGEQRAGAIRRFWKVSAYRVGKSKTFKVLVMRMEIVPIINNVFRVM